MFDVEWYPCKIFQNGLPSCGYKADEIGADGAAGEAATEAKKTDPKKDPSINWFGFVCLRVFFCVQNGYPFCMIFSTVYTIASHKVLEFNDLFLMFFNFSEFLMCIFFEF